MTIPTLRFMLRSGAAAALVILSAGTAAAGSVQYLVSVDTSSVNLSSGFLDFQFNPGDSSSQTAIARITNFNAGGGTLVSSPQVIGNVAGALPATVILVNDSTPMALNDYFQQFTYGGFFSFVLSLSGAALDSPDGVATAGSLFGVVLYDQNQLPLLTNDTFNGFAGQVSVNLDGSTTPQANPAAIGDPSVVTFLQLPEPGSMALLGFGSLVLTMLRRRHS